MGIMVEPDEREAEKLADHRAELLAPTDADTEAGSVAAMDRMTAMEFMTKILTKYNGNPLYDDPWEDDIAEYTAALAAARKDAEEETEGWKNAASEWKSVASGWRGQYKHLEAKVKALEAAAQDVINTGNKYKGEMYLPKEKQSVATSCEFRAALDALAALVKAEGEK